MAVINNTTTNFVVGTEFNDQILNCVPAYVRGNDGNDEITNVAQLALIKGNDDNDIIVNYAENSQVYLDGGDESDCIINNGQGVATLYGGHDTEDYLTDSDILVGSPYAADTFIVGEYCGYDLIQKYDQNDTILCSTISGNVPVPVAQGNDVLILGNGMYVVVQDAVGKQLNFGYIGYYEGMDFDTAENVTDNWGMQCFVATEDADNVFVSKADGSDMIFGAAQNDVIHLYDATLSDIVSTSADENSVTVNFSTGATAIVETTDNISPTFKLASGESYAYNRTTNSWQEK